MTSQWFTNVWMSQSMFNEWHYDESYRDGSPKGEDSLLSGKSLGFFHGVADLLSVSFRQEHAEKATGNTQHTEYRWWEGLPDVNLSWIIDVSQQW